MEEKELAVERISKEVIERLTGARIVSDSISGSILFLLTDWDPGLKKRLENIKILSERFKLIIGVSDHTRSLCNQDNINLSTYASQIIPEDEMTKMFSAVDDASYIIIPSFSFKTMSDLASVSDDNLFVKLSLHALLAGKRVVAVGDSISASNSATIVLKNKITSVKKEIMQLGIEFVEEKRLMHFIVEKRQATNEKLITEKEVEDFRKANANEIIVTKETIITPSARDKAFEYSMRIIKN